MNHLYKLANPLFILSLALLILNDWVLKSTLGNAFTGKLSDVAGLFAFAYFFSALHSKYKTPIHWITAILFIVWKTPIVEPLIGFLNGSGIPVSRTVDYSDYFTLPAIVLSWYVFSSEKQYHLKKWAVNGLLVLAPLAFVSTSRAPVTKRTYTMDKTYYFNYSRNELIARINELQIKEMNRIKPFFSIDFNSETNVFHSRGKTDTLALLLDPGTTGPQDTIHYRSAFAYIQISGDDAQSTLTLVKTHLYDPKPKGFRKKQFIYTPPHKKHTPEETLKIFEKRVVKKLKKKNKRKDKAKRQMDDMTQNSQFPDLNAIKQVLLRALQARENEADYRQLASELIPSNIFTDSSGTPHIGAWRLQRENGNLKLQLQMVSGEHRIIYTAYPVQQKNEWIIKDIRRRIIHRKH
ncbi:hypothetical protein [Sinomicrobium weinanense]|uniref:Uncharacterized protein n=1 Tax=Sinomicrobium weinanense TaxID=2842200 RepID=A0A926JPH2_9FLAO|nr:hypothetical protein [Sinomicrobium weinanense]MBC9795080.1 hypothetical protein [Sinomicrobium weinanense]MBU3123789.1 hypothetical protein [Sinomicrobium weinanense]